MKRAIKLFVCMLPVVICVAWSASRNLIINAAQTESIAGPDIETKPDVDESENDSGYKVVVIPNESQETSDEKQSSLDKLENNEQKYVALISLDTGEILYSRGANEKVPAGDLTGLAAALTILDYCNADEVVSVNEYNQYGMPRDDYWMNPEESYATEYSVAECLDKIIYSNSSSCLEALSDLIETRTETASYSFIKMMNKKLIAIGCKNTSFDNVFGLNEKVNWTSASDMAIIIKAVYDNDDLRKIIDDRDEDIKIAMFSGKSSLIKISRQGDEAFACILLNGNRETLYSTADELLSGSIQNSFEWGRYAKYIFAGLIILGYFLLVTFISIILNKKTKMSVSEKPGNIIANIMLATIVIGCPLYLHNKLADLSMAKAYFIIITTVVFSTLFFTLMILRFKTDILHNFKKADILLVVYLAGGLVSIIMMGAVDDGVFAVYGRYSGYLMDIIYVLILVVSIMCSKRYRGLQYAIPVVMIPLGILAVLNHYNVDPLNIYQGTSAEILNRYISTIGNVDMFSAFMGVSFVYCGMLFIKGKNRAGQIIAVVSAFVAQLSVIICSANGGYIGLIVFYAFALIFLNDRWQFIRYVILFDLFLITCAVLGYTEKVFTIYMPVDSITQYVFDTGLCLYLSIAASIILLVLSVIFIRRKNIGVDNIYVKLGLCIMYCIFVIAFSVAVIIANIKENIDSESILSFLRVGRDWGSQRGYLWSMAVEGYKELSISQKIFGIGSSNVAHLFWTQISPYDNHVVQMLDNAHCEYLQVLITHGILGFVSLYTWIVISLAGIIGRIKKDESEAIYAMSIIAYLCIAVIGLNVSYVFVLLVILLGMDKMNKVV